MLETKFSKPFSAGGVSIAIDELCEHKHEFQVEILRFYPPRELVEQKSRC